MVQRNPNPGPIVMSSIPTVSVVLPAFNRVASIRAAVESVLRQSYTDFELLIVDDGSTDGTMAALSDMQDPRIKLLSNPQNMGVSAARNMGIRNAKGVWVAFQDSDDEWMPTKLEKQMALLAMMERGFVAGYCGMAVIGEVDGKTKRRTRLHYIPDSTIDKVEGEILHDLLEHSLVSTQTLIARRDCLEAIGGFDEDLLALVDWDCVINLAKLGPFCFVDEPLVHQRFSENSITRYRDRRLASRKRIVEKNLELLQKRPKILAKHYKKISGDQRFLGDYRSALETISTARRLNPTSVKLWVISAYLLIAHLKESLFRSITITSK